MIMKLNSDVLEVLWKSDKIEMISDNGDWEYNRLGLLELNNKVGVFDCEELESSEDGSVGVRFVKVGLSMDDVKELGVESGYLVKDDDGGLWVDWDVEDDGKYEKFCELIGI